MSDVLALTIGVAFFAIVLVTPIWLTGRLFTSTIRRRILLLDHLGRRGSVHTFDMPLRMATIIFGAGAVFAGLGLVPAMIWALDGDTDGRRTFIGMVAVGVVFALLARWMVRPALSIWVVGADRLTRHRTGIAHRIGGGSEQTIEFGDLTRLHERRSIIGALGVYGTRHRFTISMQSERFDELVSALRRARPDVPYTSVRDAKRARRAAKHPPDRTRFAVSPWMIRATVGFFGALLVFFLGWPWFAVGGEHPVRDSTIFMGIGVVIWLMFAGLAALESFPRRQPTALDLCAGTIAWRTLRHGWRERELRDVVTVSVETTIIHVRGHPGYRHPLRIRFVDRPDDDEHDAVLVIGDARARQMSTSTQQLAAAIRRHVHDLSTRTDDDRHEADELVADAARAEATATTEGAAEAAEELRIAIARFPDPERLSLLAHLGDLHRRLDQHDLAESAYRAHLDLAPADPDAWQGLAATFTATSRHDLAAEATETAERHLLNRS